MMNRLNEIKELERTLIETMLTLREIDADAYLRVKNAEQVVFQEGVSVDPYAA